MPDPTLSLAVARTRGQWDGASSASIVLSGATAFDPDKEAEYRRYSMFTGMPLPTVRNLPQEARQRAAQQTVQAPQTQQALRGAPRAAQWLSNPDNAAVAHDDVGVLSWLNQNVFMPIVRGISGGQAAGAVIQRVSSPGYFTGTFSDGDPYAPYKSLFAGGAGLFSAVSGASQWYYEVQDAYSPEAFIERKLLGRTKFEGLAARAKEGRAYWTGVQEDLRPQPKAQFMRDVLGGVESIPGSLVAAGVTLETGNPYAGAAVLSAVTGGQSYGDARDAGLSVGKASAKAGIDAAIEFGTELGPERALKGFNTASPVGRVLLDLVGKEVVGEQVATLGQDFNQWAMVDANKGKSFGDYLAEIGPHARSTLVSTLTAAGAMGGAGALYGSLDRVSNRAMANEAKAAEAEAVSAHIERIAQAAAASKLRERSPEVFRDFMQEIADGSPLEAVFVDPHQLAEVLNQAGLEPEVVSALQEALGDAFGEAVRHGTDVRIPIEDFTTYLADTPAASKLADHLKADPDGMTRVEAQEYMQGQVEELKVEIEQALTESLQDEAFRQSAEAVHSAIVQQLHTANRFRADVNEANAAGMAAFYSTMAARMGQTPEELYAKYPIRIQAEGQGELAHGRVNPAIAEHVAAGPILNVGLPYGQGFGDGQNTPEEVIAAIEATGRKVLDWKLHRSDTEDTVVARVDRPFTREELGAFSGAVKQDAVAQLDREGGGLAGPLSTEWGPFSGDYFLLPDGSRAEGAVSLYQGPKDGRPEQTGNREGRDQGGSAAPLAGAPVVEGATGPDPALVAVAEAYARQAGIPYTRQTEYVELDVGRAERLAAAYEAMEHAPNDPAVREAYENLAAQTRAQYDALVAAGYQFYFFDETNDPYDGNPWNAMRDLRENKVMAVFATEGGFGSSEDFDPIANPLLADTGLTWSWGGLDGERRRVLVNDLFRAVHDAFGHGLEGAGFRARGEENAWQAHARLFTGSALAALTTETRGQNSWLNFGPYGEQNRTAAVEDTHFADQKTGLLPEWAWTEGLVDDGEYHQSAPTFYSPLERAVEQSTQAKASGQQWLATLSKAAGVKKEELDWTGLPEWLGSREGAFTRDEVLAFVKAGGVEVEEIVKGGGEYENEDAIAERESELQEAAWDDEWSDEIEEVVPEDEEIDTETIDLFDPNYVRQPNAIRYKASFIAPDFWRHERAVEEAAPDARLTGGNSYDLGEYDTEEEARAALDEVKWELFNAARDNGWGDNSYYEAREGFDTQWDQYRTRPEEGEDYTELLLRLPPGVRGNPEKTTSTHWNEEGVVAHIRFDTRYDADGNSVLAIHEIQSDWHQKGAKQGYNTKLSAEERARLEKERDDAEQAQRDLRATPEFAAWSEESSRAHAAERSAIDYLNSLRIEIRAATGVQVPSYFFQDKAYLDQVRQTIPPDALALVDQLIAADSEATRATTLRRETDQRMPHRDDLDRQFDKARSADVKLRGGAGIPDAPFKGMGYAQLALKRAIRWAVDHGHDRIVWIRGEQQNGANDAEGGWFYDRNLINIANDVLKKAGVKGASPEEIAAARAEIAAAKARISEINNELQTLKPWSNLQVSDLDPAKFNRAAVEAQIAENDRQIAILEDTSGKDYIPEAAEGYRAAADKRRASTDALRASLEQGQPEKAVEAIERVLALREEKARLSPQATQDLPSSGRVEKFDVPSLEPEDEYDYETRDPEEIQSEIDDAENWLSLGDEEADAAGITEQSVEDLKQELKDAEAERAQKSGHYGFDITPELKAAAEQGFSLFQQNRGAYSPATDTITLLKNADLSTFLHESGHFYLEMFDRLSADPNAPQDIKTDFATILKWFGVADAVTWRGMSLEQKRKHHEKWAKGVEAYMFTGKAPSIGLQGPFQRFRSWLIAVYRRAKAIGAQPTPAIRDVMDRMLATADEIALAEQARSMTPMFENREASGADEVAWREYQRRGVQASADAITELEARSLRDLRWLNNARSREINKLKRQAAATRALVTRQVTAEIMAEPVYRTMAFLKSGKIDGQDFDGPHKLYTPEIREQYGEEAASLVEQLRGMTSTENGVHPQQVAEMFGFTSVDHMLVDLTSAEPLKDKIAGAVEQRLLEDYGDLVDEVSIEQAADKAIHNEARARFVATELAMLDNAVGKPKLLASAAKGYAADMIARLKVRNLRPSLYENAAAKAARNSMDALKKGKRDVAAAEKRNQLINTYAAKAAIAAKDEVASALAYFAKFDKPGAAKSVDPSYLAQIHGLLEKIDLRKSQTLKAIDKRTSLADWIEEQRQLGLDPIIPDGLLEQIGRRSYKDMTVEELRGLRDAIKNIEHLGRLKSKLLTAKRDRDFASAVGKIADSIMVNAYKDVAEPIEKRGWLARAKDGIFDFVTDHRKLASLAREMDGGRDGGAVWEYFIRPMNEAADREAKMRHEAATALAEIFAPIGKFGEKKFIPEIGQSLSLEGRMAIALNMGNEINRERVLTGERWDQGQLDAVLETLTAEQWGIVQQVWDYIGSYWPEIAAKQVRVTGVEPERVDAAPLKVSTADGQTLELRGGYYPIKYNADRSSRAEGHDLAEYAKQALRGAYTAATTRRGHTKARIESTGMALRYDLGVVTQHLTEVIHDLTHHELLIDVTRLLRASTVDGAIRAHYGADVRQAFRKTIEAVAAGDVPAKNSFERLVGHLRNGITISGLGWNLATGLLQPLGLFQSIVRIGPQWVGKGFTRWISDAASFENTVAWITEQSPMMAERSRTMMREINDINNRIDDRSGVTTAVEASFFYLIAKFQRIADVPTWLGQYEKSVAAGEDHDTAVALADQAVLDAQGGGQQKDLAEIQRGGPMMKVWTTFYSYFNVTYNLMAESVNETRRVGPKRLPLLAVDFLLLTSVPTTIGLLIKAALKGEPPDEEDIVKQNIASVLNMWVGARDIGAIVTSDGRQAAPAGLAMAQFANLYKQTAQGELDEAWWKALNRTAGIVFHYPSGQVERTVLGAEALAEGQSANPGVLVTGPPRK